MNVLTHLMFQDGRAREAAKWYVSLVPGSSIERVIDSDAEGAIVYFTLAGQGFIAFDSPIRHGFDFTPSMSIFVRCDDEEQVSSPLRPDRLRWQRNDACRRLRIQLVLWLGYGSLRRVVADGQS
jgi:3-demethylubiquinone-9 3-methyltransferase